MALHPIAANSTIKSVKRDDPQGRLTDRVGLYPISVGAEWPALIRRYEPPRATGAWWGDLSEVGDVMRSSNGGPGSIESLAPSRTSARSAEFRLSKLPRKLPPIRKPARVEPRAAACALDNWLREQAVVRIPTSRRSRRAHIEADRGGCVLSTHSVSSSRAHRVSAMWRRAIIRRTVLMGKTRP
jgi:hypothetical protein